MESIHFDTVGATVRRFTYSWMLTWMLKCPKIILTVFGLLTIFLGLQIPSLLFHFSIHDLIIEKLPETHAYHRHFRTFGSEEIIKIVFKSHKIYDPLVFNTLEYLTDASDRIPGVNRVISLPRYRELFTASSAGELDKFEQMVAPAELLQNTMISTDKKATAIILFLAKDADHNVLMKRINELLREEKITPSTYLTGIPVINQTIKKMIQQDACIFPALMILITSLLLYLLMRKTVPVLLILTTIIVSHIWTLGFIALLDLRISFLSSLAPLFLLGVQSAFCLHIIASCSGNYRAGTPPVNPMIVVFDKTTLPFIISIVITFFSLLSFLFNPINAINEFGTFTILGMATFLLLMFTFFPLALSVLPKPYKNKCTQKDIKISRIHRLLNSVFIHPKKQQYLFPIFVGVTIICLIGLIHIKIETNPFNFFSEKTTIAKNHGDKYNYMSADFPICVALKAPQKNYFSNPQHVKTIERFQGFIETLPGVNHTVSFADHLKLLNFSTNAYIPQMYRIPHNRFILNRLKRTSAGLLDRKTFQTYINSDFSKANILVNTRQMDYHQFQQIRKTIKAHIRKELNHGFQVNITGMGPALLTSSYHLVNSQIKSTLISLLMLFGILWFLLISLKIGILVLLPTIFPVISIFGLMGWLGISLTFTTGFIATMIICISAGNVIHYIVRYNTEFKIDLDNHRAMKTTFDALVTPIVFGALTICSGFSILFFSDLIPIANIAALIIPAILAMLASNLILLPMLLQKVELITIWDLLRLKLTKSPDKKIPLFDELARHQVHSILMAGTLQKLNPKEVLFNKGDTSDTMYAIVSGSLDIINFHRYEDATGVHEIQKVVNQLYAGDVVGEMGFFRSTQRSATAVATEKTELLQINWQMIRRLQWLYPLTAQKFFINLMGIICDRLENVTNTLCDQSLIDDLTGLYNKKGFTQLLETETNRAQRYREELTICLIGLDLEEENIPSDGPKAIEVMIRMVCQMLSREIRRTDNLSRIDTTIFAMVAPKTSQAQAKILCRRLRQILHRNLLGFGSPSLKVRLISTNLARANKETGMDLLERSLTLLEATQE